MRVSFIAVFKRRHPPQSTGRQAAQPERGDRNLNTQARPTRAWTDPGGPRSAAARQRGQGQSACLSGPSPAPSQAEPPPQRGSGWAAAQQGCPPAAGAGAASVKVFTVKACASMCVRERARAYHDSCPSCANVCATVEPSRTSLSLGASEPGRRPGGGAAAARPLTGRLRLSSGPS